MTNNNSDIQTNSNSNNDSNIPVVEIPVTNITISDVNTSNNIVPNINLTIEELNKVKTFKYAKTLKCFSIIDIFLCIIHGFLFLWPLIFVALMPLAGYYGFSKYKKCYIYIYMSFIFINIVYNITFFFYVTNFSSLFFNFIYFFINLWIFELIYKFIKNITKLKEETIEDLRNGWTPLNQTFILI